MFLNANFNDANITGLELKEALFSETQWSTEAPISIRSNLDAIHEFQKTIIDN
jgi:uncharacterized protein YjbI with pentapeptide repeats